MLGKERENLEAGYFLIVPGILRTFSLKSKINLFPPVFIHSQTSVALTVDSGRGSGSILRPSTPRTEGHRASGALPSWEMNLIGFLNNSMASASGLTSCYSSRVTCLLHWSKITVTTDCLRVKLLVCVCLLPPLDKRAVTMPYSTLSPRALGTGPGTQ